MLNFYESFPLGLNLSERKTKMIYTGPAGKIFKTCLPDNFFLVTETGETIKLFGPFSGDDVKTIYNFLLSPDHSVNSDGRVFDNQSGKIVFEPKKEKATKIIKQEKEKAK